MAAARARQGWFKKYKRQTIFGVATVLMIIAAVFAVFFFTIPLKTEHVVNNLQNYYFAADEYSVGNEADTLLQGYFSEVIAPALINGNCANYVSVNCSAQIAANGNNKVTALYSTWAKAKIENQLAAKSGIKLRYDTNTQTFYLVAPSIPDTKGAAVSKSGDSQIDDAMYAAVDQGNVRQSIIDSLNDITQWKNVLYRYKIDRFLEEKYGINRCLIYCGNPKTVQWFANLNDNIAQVLIANLVTSRQISVNSTAADCWPGIDPLPPVDDGPCDLTATSPLPLSNPEELHGEPESQPENEIRGYLAGEPKNYHLNTAVDVQQLDAAYKRAASDWKPSSDTGDGQGSEAGSEKAAYIVNATGAVDYYMLYKVYVDETHNNYKSTKEEGDFVKTVGPGDNSPGFNEFGGTATAESAPLYSSIVKDDATPVNNLSSINNLLFPKVKADSSEQSVVSNNYICGDGSKPMGLLCPEEQLGGHAAITYSGPGQGGPHDAPTRGGPFGPDMSGARSFDMLAAGADVAGSDFAHHGLGGKLLTNEEWSSILAAQDLAKASAIKSDPFKMPHYGYTSDDLKAIGNPEDFWSQNCSDGVNGHYTSAWDNRAAGTTDQSTGMPVNMDTDACLLIDATVGSVSAVYSTSLLESDDLADINPKPASDQLPPAELQALTAYPNWVPNNP